MSTDPTALGRETGPTVSDTNETQDRLLRSGWRRLLHVHRDPDWQVRGVWRYYECRCGARRVARATSNLMGPSDPAWPKPRNRHGEHMNDSGWRTSW